MNHADGICSLGDVFAIERELDIGTSVCRCLKDIGHKTPVNLNRLGFAKGGLPVMRVELRMISSASSRIMRPSVMFLVLSS